MTIGIPTEVLTILVTNLVLAMLPTKLVARGRLFVFRSNTVWFLGRLGWG